MSNRAVLQFLVICITYYATEAKTHFEDYCWRDYEGIVPSDALQGGYDNLGKLLYIGQVLFQDKLVIGKIHDGDSKIYFEWYDEVHTSNRNIKILCTQQPEKLAWTPVEYNEVTKSPHVLVKGGFEDNNPTYIGRAMTDRELSVGKVVCSTQDCFGLYTIVSGRVHIHKRFEVLTIQPQNIINYTPPIDVRFSVAEVPYINL